MACVVEPPPSCPPSLETILAEDGACTDLPRSSVEGRRPPTSQATEGLSGRVDGPTCRRISAPFGTPSQSFVEFPCCSIMGAFEIGLSLSSAVY